MDNRGKPLEIPWFSCPLVPEHTERLRTIPHHPSWPGADVVGGGGGEVRIVIKVIRN
jgi:hypothetical protein